MIKTKLLRTLRNACESYSIIENMNGRARFAGYTEQGSRRVLVQKGKDDNQYEVAYRSVRLAHGEPAWEFLGIKKR